jgi:RES domain
MALRRNPLRAGRGASPANPPPPPAWLAGADLPIEELGAGTELHRIHRRVERAVFFGPGPGRAPTHRFDAPGGEFGVLYVGLDFTAAFVETLLRKPAIRIIDLVDLEIRNAAILTAARPLRLVQAYGAGLSRIGCTAALSTARYSLAGAWSLAFWSHKDAPDGLIYHSRYNPEHRCAAVFNRRKLALRIVRTSPLLADTARVAGILEAHGKSVAPR